MRNYLLLILVTLCCTEASAQYKTLTLGGGYVFANIKDTETSASGWRLNGTYEIHPTVGKVLHGFTISYLTVSADVEEISQGQTFNTKYSISTWPFYYQPKILFGEGSLKAFIKGAVGMHFSTVKAQTVGLDEFTSTDAGFYGGLGAGITKEIDDHVFINLEYEWAYLSNTYYRDGFLHSACLGVGFRLD